MRRRLRTAAAALFLAAGLQAAEPAYDPVRARVIQEERELKQAEYMAEMAEKAKMTATQDAIDKKAKADAATWRRQERKLKRMAE